jgi:hypothetical protein
MVTAPRPTEVQEAVDTSLKAGMPRRRRPYGHAKGGTQLDTQSKGNYTNTAQLKELMTAPPMTAEQHAAINRKRIRDRRMIEEAKERRMDENNLF